MNVVVHMGYVDDVLFGYEVIEELPGMVKHGLIYPEVNLHTLANNNYLIVRPLTVVTFPLPGMVRWDYW
jgi:hypothetical protein